MMVFGNTSGVYGRGDFHEITLSGEKGLGAYLTFPDRSLLPGITSNTQFVSDVSFSQKERYSIVQCFNDRNYVYAFGHDPTSSAINIRYTAFLRNAGCAVGGSTVEGDSVLFMTEKYADNRLTESLQRCVLTLGANVVVSGFLVGMSSSVASAELNLTSFDFTLIATEIMDGRA